MEVVHSPHHRFPKVVRFNNQTQVSIPRDLKGDVEVIREGTYVPMWIHPSLDDVSGMLTFNFLQPESGRIF
jgi:hypothetical protein